MDDRGNTIAGWVLGAGIVALGFSIFSGKMTHGETPEAGKQGYVIQGVESAEGGAGAAAVPLSTLLASADAAKGEAVFKKCAACHNVAPGGPNAIGPALHGVLGKGVAGHAGFAYSDGLKAKGGNWTFEAMNEWLTNPKKFAPGTKMTFAGLGNPEERANLIVYMNAQGSNLPLPAAEAAPAAPTSVEGAAVAPAAPAAPAK
jgi:cytochrome c